MAYNIIPSPFYTYTIIFANEVKLGVYDWLKVTQQVSMAKWEFETGTSRS